MIYVRGFSSGTSGKVGAVVAGTVLLIVVGAFLTFGFLLLLGVAAAGLLLGIGAALRRRVTGRTRVPREALRPKHDLDPTLEVQPPPKDASSRY